MNLIEIILDEMQTDDENTTKQSWRIIRTYEKASNEQKDLVDDILISLCGWSVPTLIDMVRDSQANIKEEDEEEADNGECLHNFNDDICTTCGAVRE